MPDTNGLTLQEFEAFFSKLSWVPARAEEIAKSIQKTRCHFEGFSSDGEVRYSYHDGCNCHGHTEYGTFPASLLFEEL